MSTTSIILTAKTGAAQINTSNTNVDGTGPMALLCVGGASYGSVINTITVKATLPTTSGMVRLFLEDLLANRFLIDEINVRATDPNQTYGVVTTFSTTQIFPSGGFKLAPGWQLFAATQNPETFNVIVEGFDQNYCGCS